MIDILNELKIVEQERRQLRTRVESMDNQHTEVFSTWDQSLGEMTSRQDAMAVRVGRNETHINTIAQDQNYALESNQALWRSTQEHMESDQNDQEGDHLQFP